MDTFISSVCCYGLELIKKVLCSFYIWKTPRWSQAPCLWDQHSANLTFNWIQIHCRNSNLFARQDGNKPIKKDSCLAGRVSSVVESRVAKERRVLGFNWCDCRIFSKENTWDGKGLREQDSQINLRSKVKKSQEGRCHLHGHRGREAGEEERQVEE